MNIIDKAIHFATDVHSGQYRKGGKEYYIFHPLEVACIASALTSDESVIAAAALHDTVEDTATSIEDIRREFGSRIAALVASETENKRHGLPKSETWETRKKETIEKLENCSDIGVLIVTLSDKLSNMRSFYRLKFSEGEKMWLHFSQKDPKWHLWYYRSIANILKCSFENTCAWAEYDRLISIVFDENERGE